MEIAHPSRRAGQLPGIGAIALRCSLLLLVGLVLLASTATPATAQNYRFQVESMELELHVQPDASVKMHYRITFANQLGAHPIDIVDVGLPHKNYKLSTMSASLDGQPLRTIRDSEYIATGVEVHLDEHQIMPGQRGTLDFTCTMPDMVYADTTNNQQASLQIKPTWFDSDLQVGVTSLTIAMHVPPGIEPEEVVYHSEDLPFSDKVFFGQGDEQHVVAVWRFPGHRLSSQNPKVGVSFPRRTMQRVVEFSAIDLLVKWLQERPEIQAASGLLLVGLWGFVFFRFSGGTGCVLFVIGMGVLIFLMVSGAGWHLVLWPVLAAATGLNEWLHKRPKPSYLPAMATVEGGGIKRGLTAPQAAVLLELPLSKIVTLVIFGLLKKGVLRQLAADPLRVEVAKPFRVARKQRIKAAAKAGAVLHQYEQPFVDLLLTSAKDVREHDFGHAVTGLIKETAKRMKGFDLTETKAYYRKIVSRAWTEAESIGEIEKRTAAIDAGFDWMMMAPDWNDRFGRWHGSGYNYQPVWTRSTGGGTSVPTTGGSSAGSPGHQVGTSEMAASFAGWAENTAGSLTASIEPASLGISSPSAGLVDLSSVDTMTSDFFEALASSSGGGGGGGGGGGCACACAGCACACACAGGGR